MLEETGVQPRFQALEATGDRQLDAGFARGRWSAVEHWLAWPSDPSTGEIDVAASGGDANLLEARSLAADIRRLHDEAEVKWGTIAVLLRATTAQEVVLDCFREAGVPFEVAREREYYRQREVVEAAALVRCVLEPGDGLALLTVLRCDAVGVPDAALVPLWESALPALLADLQAADATAMAAVDACLERALATAPTDLPGAAELPRWPIAVAPPSRPWALRAVARRRRTVCGAPAHLVADRGHRVGALPRRFRRSASSASSPSSRRPRHPGRACPVARFLRRAVEQGRDSQQPAEPDVASDAVHVMTIHGAKGLDFEHVYLVQLHRKTGGGTAASEAELRPTPVGLQYRLFGWPTPGFAEADSLRAAQARAEQVRLLYVAMTRAKKRLVLSGRWRADGALVPARKAGTFAELVSHRLDPAATDAQLRERQRTRREAERPVQWMALGIDEPSARTTGAQRAASSTRTSGGRGDGTRPDARRRGRRGRVPGSAPVTSLVSDDGGGWTGHREMTTPSTASRVGAGRW
jgi:ATP-dependent helicase/nuclease subunit A